MDKTRYVVMLNYSTLHHIYILLSHFLGVGSVVYLANLLFVLVQPPPPPVPHHLHDDDSYITGTCTTLTRMAYFSEEMAVHEADPIMDVRLRYHYGAARLLAIREDAGGHQWSTPSASSRGCALLKFVLC